MSAVKSPPSESFAQLVRPNLGTRDATGMCLRFAQSVFGAPVNHKSATVAANHTKFRHHTRELPNVAAIVWLDHYGTYGDPPTRDNWGHVAAWVPGYGILSSPAAGYGQQWFPSIDAVERAFNATFRFWTEDINGLRVAAPTKKKDGDPMPTTTTMNRKAGQKLGKTWQTLQVSKEGYWSLMQGGKDKRRTQGVIGLAVSRGDIDVRVVRQETSADGSGVKATYSQPFLTLRPGYGQYTFLADLPAGSTHRLRLQARARADTAQIDNVEAALHYWAAQ